MGASSEVPEASGSGERARWTPLLTVVPYLVLGLSLALTALSYRFVDQGRAWRVRGEFEAQAREVGHRLLRRLHADEQVLRGAVGLFQASDEVSREEWRRYVAALRFDERYPGIRGLGYVEWIPAAALAAHQRRLRAEGFLDYQVTPPGERVEYSAVVFLEPLDERSRRALGYDGLTDPARRAVMERARDSGATAISGPIPLDLGGAEGGPLGALMCAPVYRRGAAAATPVERREALRGFVCSPLRMKDLVTGALEALPAGLTFRLFSGPEADPQALLFDRLEAAPEPLPAGWSPDLTHDEPLDVFGQPWLLRASALPGFTEREGREASLAVVLGGVPASLLLFGLALFMARAQRRALAWGRALQEGEARYRALFELGPVGVVVIDPKTRGFVDFNDQACAQLGYTREEFARLTLDEVDAGESAAEVGARIQRVMESGHAEFEAVHRDKLGWLHDVRVLARYKPVAGDHLYHCLWRDVTLEKQAEAARRREEARFHSYFDLPLVGAALTSPEKGWLRANDRLCALLGYSRDELAALTWAELTHPDDLAADQAQFAEVMAGRRDGYALEKRFLRKSGEVLWASLAVQCVRDAQGRVEYFAALLDDITTRKLDEQVLQARLALASGALDGTLESLLVQTLDQVELLTASAIGFFHFVEPDEEALVLQAWSTRTARKFCKADGHGSHYPVAQAGIWADAVRERRPVIHNDYASAPGRKGLPPGHAVLVRELVVPIFRSGKVVAALGVGNKATAYTEADVELVRRFADLAWDVAEKRQVQDRLRESDARFGAAFDSAPIMMTLSRLEDGAYLDVNRRFIEVSGFSKAEAVGKTSLGLGWISQAERDRLIAGLRADGRVAALELKLRAKGGREITAIFWGEILTVQGQRCILSLAQDVTSERRLQVQLAEAQRLESVGRLAGGVAHDFNNMLAVILGHTELLLQGEALDPDLGDGLKEISDSAHRAAAVTRQLLAFARKQTIQPQVLDLDETLGGMLKMLRRLIGEDVELAWTPGAGAARVRIDPSQVDQLVANLCVNGRDAIEGVGRITIATTTVAADAALQGRHPGLGPGPWVRLTVNDDGAGIPPDVLPHVFEPFFTTKAQGRGTGLGLATVYGIVTQNRGAVEVESAPGAGTTFHLWFPCVASAPVLAPEAPRAAVPRGVETVLVVEDEPAVLRMCAEQLERLGYQVLQAGGPMEAIKLAAQHAGKVQLLMTDVVMPGMSGKDLATMLLLGHPGMCCLFMSGYTTETMARHGVGEGGAVFLQKPFDAAALAVKVRQALAGG